MPCLQISWTSHLPPYTDYRSRTMGLTAAFSSLSTWRQPYEEKKFIGRITRTGRMICHDFARRLPPKSSVFFKP
ncbi:hypothetical protein KSP39_PZI007018 [Platanthera zijinensis]|uniref:Uncharacterized protein n=1 Tax=Platanthera zijinensis TaxID=2320716 RepID=A0AAP0BPU8_9ASPA